MLMDSVYFPDLKAMLFEACEKNVALQSILLKQAAAYTYALRPLELFGEASCSKSVQPVVEVRACL